MNKYWTCIICGLYFEPGRMVLCNDGACIAFQTTTANQHRHPGGLLESLHAVPGVDAAEEPADVSCTNSGMLSQSKTGTNATTEFSRYRRTRRKENRKKKEKKKKKDSNKDIKQVQCLCAGSTFAFSALLYSRSHLIKG